MAEIARRLSWSFSHCDCNKERELLSWTTIVIIVSYVLFVPIDGRYIMDSSGGMDDPKLENVRAMIEFTREYGVYCMQSS
jgi:alpha-D-ribose 1-methylphosphonate 5-phosphate C-P lyase